MIPKQWEICNPLLKLAVENERFGFSMAFKWLGEHFELTDLEREEMLRSRQRRFDNRVRWAVINLKEAGLLTKVDKEFSITEEGKRAHESGDTIDYKYLMLPLPPVTTKERIEGGEHGQSFVQRNVPKPMPSIQDCETLCTIQPCCNFLDCGQGVVLP